MSTAVAIYSNNYSSRKELTEIAKYEDEDQNPFEEMIGCYFKECVPYGYDENDDRIMHDFNIIATLEEFPEEGIDDDAKEIELLDEEATRQADYVKLVRSIRINLKRSSERNPNHRENQEIPSENADTYKIKVVWDKPYVSPTSVLKKPNSPEKPMKKVHIITPPTHKEGYHPVRTMGGGVYLRKRARKHSMRQIRQNAIHYLFDCILAPKYYNRNAHVKPICPSEFFYSLNCGYVDFVIIVNCGPEDFFVRIGHLEFRRRFNYMEHEMKEWYTRKKGLMEYCATTLEDAEYLSYYVMFHLRFDEYVRVQISFPVVTDVQENPNEIVIVALIDYGGHLYVHVGQLLPLMPYFAIFPKMALRGVLALARNLGRTTFTDNEETVFQNLIADYNGIVEATITKPRNADDLKKYDDNGTFGIIELILFVMSNGKRKTIDEILFNEAKQNEYLRGPTHYPSVEEFREEQETNFVYIKDL